MSYTPTTWNTGDTVTASAMNKIENGIANAGSALIVTSSYVNGVQTMDKTVQEIYDALLSGTPVYYKYAYGTPATTYESYTALAPITYIYTYSNGELIRVVIIYAKNIGGISNKNYLLAPSACIFQASDLDEYPTLYANVTSGNNTVS